MSAVLNPGELTMLALFEADIQERIDGIGDTLIRDELQVASMVHRLVAEVERLRARNEALEKVAKAAEGARELLVRDCVMPERHGPTVDREVAEAICDSCAAQSRAQLRAALSALNPSDPNSSGGEP